MKTPMHRRRWRAQYKNEIWMSCNQLNGRQSNPLIVVITFYISTFEITVMTNNSETIEILFFFSLRALLFIPIINRKTNAITQRNVQSNKMIEGRKWLFETKEGNEAIILFLFGNIFSLLIGLLEFFRMLKKNNVQWEIYYHESVFFLLRSFCLLNREVCRKMKICFTWKKWEEKKTVRLSAFCLLQFPIFHW